MLRLQSPLSVFLILLFALLLGLQTSAQEGRPAQKGFGKPQIDAVQGEVKAIANAKVVDFGKTIYRGTIDVRATIERIRQGKKLDHRNDGAIFFNREGRLPRKRDREYYREFVHAMKGLPFPGPQRIVIGKQGEVYYTGDHYSSFTKVR